MKILLADDEKALTHFLNKGLMAEGYECYTVNEIDEVIPSIKAISPEVIVLDRLFGDSDSIDIVAKIKSLKPAPMMLMLTALDEVSERVKGLQKGADDYLCKPFDFDELLARVSALGRRYSNESQSEPNCLSLGSLNIYTDQRIAKLGKKELVLTKIEYDLLLYLSQNRDKVLSRERILNRVWQMHSDPHTNVIDVYISKLRKKLDDDLSIVIQTLRGNGYRLTLSAISTEL